MNFATFIAVTAIVLMLFLAVRYIYREKKKGNACIGCPYAGSCRKQYGNAQAEKGTACRPDLQKPDSDKGKGCDSK